jgi:hypothetical protein
VAPFWRYHRFVPSVQVKDVPPKVHKELKRRAALSGQSLQEYLLDLFIEETSHPTQAEVFARMRSHSGGRAPLADVVRFLREDRDSH